MTLKEVIYLIEKVASKQPSVNMIVKNDVFRLNACPSAKYGVFAWLQGAHTGEVSTSTRRYSFTFFYVDRLTEDKSNEIDIQSTGDSTLDNIIRELDELGLYADTYTIQTFNQRFVDECAGVFCTVTFDVPIDTQCAYTFDDYTQDYNNDFPIF